MRIHGVVRVLEKPAPSREEHGKCIKIRARVSFDLQRSVSNYSLKNQKYDSFWFSSTFVDFVAFKRHDGSDPRWVEAVVPGAFLNIENGVIYESVTKQNQKGTLRIEIHEATEVKIRNKKDQTDTPVAVAVSADKPSEVSEDDNLGDDDIPF